MKNEIGGYMEFETYSGNEYHENLIPLNTARSAIQYIIKCKNYKKIYIPYYLCDCIAELFERIHLQYEFYNTTHDWLPKSKDRMNKNECIFIVNYFGQLTNDTIMNLKNIYGNIIVDNTQSFFQKPIHEIDTIFNCRKYFGVADGAYLNTASYLNDILGTDITYDRFQYLIGRYETKASDFYEEFKGADDSLKEKKLKYMSKLSRNILKSIPYDEVAEIRSTNFNLLHEKLAQYNELKSLRTGTFMYPFMNQKAEEIRHALIVKKIYIPILWPNVLDSVPKNSYEYYCARNIVPIPIDHRYGEEEMYFIAEEIIKQINMPDGRKYE